jgi:hypothetical protein
MKLLSVKVVQNVLYQWQHQVNILIQYPFICLCSFLMYFLVKDDVGIKYVSLKHDEVMILKE